MDLTLAAIVIMGGWVVAMVAAGLAMILRPGGVAIRFAPAGAPLNDVTGRRDELLPGGHVQVLGNARGPERAGHLRRDHRRHEPLAPATARGSDEQQVPANPILASDRAVVPRA